MPCHLPGSSALAFLLLSDAARLLEHDVVSSSVRDGARSVALATRRSVPCSVKLLSLFANGCLIELLSRTGEDFLDVQTCLCTRLEALVNGVLLGIFD